MTCISFSGRCSVGTQDGYERWVRCCVCRAEGGHLLRQAAGARLASVPGAPQPQVSDSSRPQTGLSQVSHSQPHTAHFTINRARHVPLVPLRGAQSDAADVRRRSAHIQRHGCGRRAPAEAPPAPQWRRRRRWTSSASRGRKRAAASSRRTPRARERPVTVRHSLPAASSPLER
jgi:hypothetical protein